jgi:ribonuclease R
MDIRQFTFSAIKEAESFIISDELLAGRDIVKGYTVDSFTSRDLDDGFNLFEQGDNYLLQVSIADVAEAVPFESELFSISLERLETRYLRDSNLPMLPKVLSENKMSLMPDGLRPSITFDIELTPETEVVDFRIRETVFNSLGKLSYEKFDAIKNSGDNSEAQISFTKMTELAFKLIEIRRKKGALAIYDIKKGIFTDEEGMIQKLEKHQRYSSHLVVQEFMILTNKTLAMYCAKNDWLFLYRNHTARLSAPNRNDILEQINTVLMNPEHLESLRTRGSLWFNRAKYSPMIHGHFGLNEPVYSHTTSPIRRIADLINHNLIKSYLKNKVPPYTMKQLIELTEKINSGIAEIKDKKSEMFKEKAILSGESKLNFHTEKYLAEMPVPDFMEILYSAVKSNFMNDKLKGALISRFENKNVDMKIIYTILFKSEENSSEWSEFKIMCIDYLNENKGFAVALLNIFVQKGLIEKYETELLESIDGYKAKITAFQKSREITPPFYSLSSRKKDAVSMSAYYIVRLLLDMTVEAPSQSLPVNVDCIINEENTLSPSPLPLGEVLSIRSEVPGKNEINYVGILMEMCQKNKGWSISDFNFIVSGLSHLPTITCTVILNTPGVVIEETVISSNKKAAKQDVAKKILDKLNESGNSSQSDKSPELLIDKDNPVGSLQELCSKFKLPNPEYSFRNIGTVHNPLFECELKIFTNKKPYFFKKTAENKKSAKQNCAEECFKIINDIVNI